MSMHERMIAGGVAGLGAIGLGLAGAAPVAFLIGAAAGPAFWNWMERNRGHVPRPRPPRNPILPPPRANRTDEWAGFQNDEYFRRHSGRR